MDFHIEKYCGREKAPKSTSGGQYDWQLAYGINKRSFIKTNSEEDAIKQFKVETQKVRKVPYRLKAYHNGAFGGYTSQSTIIASINCSDSK